MNISTALFQELVAFLTPLPCFENERARKTLLLCSGLGELLPHIECAKPKEFVTLAIHQLAKYGDIAGEPALLMLLRGVANEVGTDKQAMLQDFEERLKSEQPARRIFPPKDNPPRQTPPARSFSRATISMLGLIALMITVAVVVWRFGADKGNPKGEKATPHPILPSSERPGVGAACWENATPGATCAEETTGMEFVYVPGGCFQMGSNDGASNEKPVHKVCLKGFWMGKYEVTQAQWENIMGTNPSLFKGADRPVETVSWNDCQAFLKKLNAHPPQSPLNHGGQRGVFRLPSEAEWEYAARAGTQTAYSFGDDPARLGDYAWFDGNSGNNTHPVGQKKPNAFGLYDMHGNVWEWCQDWYDEAYYANSPRENPTGPSSGQYRLLRGGSWCNNTSYCRSAFRLNSDPDNRGYNVGVRVLARTQ